MIIKYICWSSFEAIVFCNKQTLNIILVCAPAPVPHLPNSYGANSTCVEKLCTGLAMTATTASWAECGQVELTTILQSLPELPEETMPEQTRPELA